MMYYIKAENLKCRRTFAKKLVLIAPLLMVFLASISGIYLVQNGYNWWYTILLPGFITLATALVNQIEERKLRYRTIFALPVSLQKIWSDGDGAYKRRHRDCVGYFRGNRRLLVGLPI